MINFLIILVIAIIIAALLFALLKKVVKLALFLAYFPEPVEEFSKSVSNLFIFNQNSKREIRSK